jgi:hypothetical protein
MKKDNRQPAARNLRNIGGIFFILFGGLAVALCIALLEFAYKRRQDPRLAEVRISAHAHNAFVQMSLCAAVCAHLRLDRLCLASPSTPRQRLRRASAEQPRLWWLRRGYPVIRHEHMQMAGGVSRSCSETLYDDDRMQ